MNQQEKIKVVCFKDLDTLTDIEKHNKSKSQKITERWIFCGFCFAGYIYKSVSKNTVTNLREEISI